MPFYLLQSRNAFFPLFNFIICIMQGCVFTKDINKAMLISDAMETGTVQINSAPSRGPDHFPFQVKIVLHFPSCHKICIGCNTSCRTPFYRKQIQRFPPIKKDRKNSSFVSTHHHELMTLIYIHIQ